VAEIDTDAIRTQLRKHGDLPKLTCADMADEIDTLRARLAAVEALCDRTGCGPDAWLYVIDVLAAVHGEADHG
jgi:hypothetical protein